MYRHSHWLAARKEHRKEKTFCLQACSARLETMLSRLFRYAGYYSLEAHKQVYSSYCLSMPRSGQEVAISYQGSATQDSLQPLSLSYLPAAQDWSPIKHQRRHIQLLDLEPLAQNGVSAETVVWLKMMVYQLDFRNRLCTLQ